MLVLILEGAVSEMHSFFHPNPLTIFLGICSQVAINTLRCMILPLNDIMPQTLKLRRIRVGPHEA